MKDGVKALAFIRDFVAWIDFLKNGWMLSQGFTLGYYPFLPTGGVAGNH
jgi:hypothetical protein